MTFFCSLRSSSECVRYAESAADSFQKCFCDSGIVVLLSSAENVRLLPKKLPRFSENVQRFSNNVGEFLRKLPRFLRHSTSVCYAAVYLDTWFLFLAVSFRPPFLTLQPQSVEPEQIVDKNERFANRMSQR